MNPLKPVNVSTGGIHPQVKKAVVPRMKAAKQFSAAARGSAMAKMPGVKKPLMSRTELSSKRAEQGRMPRG